jgi:hypothetical protein
MNENRYYGVRVEGAKYGVGFGSALAIAISYTANHSILWAIIRVVDQRFFDPIPVPDHKPLITLRDAALYIAKLPKAEHDAVEWQAAMEALILSRRRAGPTMFARIGVMQALNHGKPDPAIGATRQARQSLQGHSLAGNGGYATLRFSAEVLPRLSVSS